MFDKILKNI